MSRMKLHTLLFGLSLLVGGAFVARILLEHEHLAAVRAAGADAGVERMLATLVKSQQRVEAQLDSLSVSVARLRARSAPKGAAPGAQEEGVAPSVARAAAATEAAVAAPAEETADAACPERRAFHGLLTSQSSAYQQWQSRIMYHHWKKQKALQGPCGDMGGFTRLCATKDGAPDGLEKEIPSIFVEQLSDEIIARHFHFGVLNRPHSVKILLETPRLLEQITSSFVLILETDHVLMKPIPNLATATTPAAYTFGYMHAHSAQNSVIQKYWPEGSASSMDPVGPSPLLIHLDQLRAITPRWLNFSFGLRSNSDAERVMQGWVQEMWGYSIAAASVGVRHKLVRDFQVEHGASARPAADFDKGAYIFHYTYGIEYTMSGRPQGVNQIGEWSLDKRHYGADHPPRKLQPPPEGANAAATWLLNAWNEASAAIPDWPQSKSMGTLGWRRNKISSAELAESAVARGAQGLKWAWAGVPGFALTPGGALETPWGAGTWGVVRDAAPGSPPTPFTASDEEIILRCNGCLFADFANSNHNLVFDGDAPKAFRAIRVGDYAEVKGTLA